LHIKSNDEYVCTYNVDQPNINNIPENTILVHRKKETNTLYTINALNELIKLEEEKESNLITQFEKRQVDVGERLSHKFTVEEATVPEIKFWPKRSFIFIISVLGTIIATAVVLVCFELFWKK
jgi:hypothetical protein